RKIRAFIARARARQADLVVFPELCITGYPPRDLVEQTRFIEKNRQSVQELANETKEVGVIVGYVEANRQLGEKQLYNSAAFVASGRVQAVRHKCLLPTYDVFDESRHFAPGPANEPIPFRGKRIGLHICEDMWHVPEVWPQTPYKNDPVAYLAKHETDIFI